MTPVNHVKGLIILFVFAAIFLLLVGGCSSIKESRQYRDYSSYSPDTAAAFDRLLSGTWKSPSGSIVKFVSGKNITVFASRKAKGYGFSAGDVGEKDFHYIGNNQFRCLTQWKQAKPYRSFWLRSRLTVTPTKIYREYEDVHPDTGRPITTQEVFTLEERLPPPEPNLSIIAVRPPDSLRPNSVQEVTVTVRNQGDGYARNVVGRLHTSKNIGGLHYDPHVSVGHMASKESKNISIPVRTDDKLEGGKIPFTIEVTDDRGNTVTKSFTITSEDAFERGLPPNLFAELSFQDRNGNGILEAGESAEIELTIYNRGKGKAQALKIFLEDNLNDRSLKSESAYVPVINPGESHTVTIPIKADLAIKAAEHKLKINVLERFGYDMDPAYLVLNTAAYQRPELVFAGLEIFDFGEDTAAIVQDDRLQAGELVKAKIVVQNIGQGTAENTEFSIISEDENIYLENNKGRLGIMRPGKVKEFWVTISPNKRVKTEQNLPLYLSLREKIGNGNLERYQLPIRLNINPPETKIVKVKPDIASLKAKIARFEYKSNKFKINLGRLIDIKTVQAAKAKRKHSIGVVIGIEKYAELPPAPYATNDANLMKEYFKKRLGVEQVVMYKNDEVSGFRFDDIFNPDYGDLQKAIVEGKSGLFVYYSGHGIPSKSGTEVYLFPYDGKLASLDKRGFSMKKFFDYLSKLGAKHVTVILDACFSGGARASAKIRTENLVAMKGMTLKIDKPWLWYNNFTVINSSQADETSLGYDEAECGLFTYYMCAGLKGHADANGDRKITLGELKGYVTRNVMDTSRKIRGLQTPEFYGDENQVLVNY